MPQLPTFNVTDAQANRILEAFGTTQAYKDWLRNSIKNFVTEYETRTILQNTDMQVGNKIQEIESDLGTIS